MTSIQKSRKNLTLQLPCLTLTWITSLRKGKFFLRYADTENSDKDTPKRRQEKHTLFFGNTTKSMSAINDMEAEYERQILETWKCPYCFQKIDEIDPSQGISPKDHIWYEENHPNGWNNRIYIPAAHRVTFVTLIDKLTDRAINWILDKFLKKRESTQQYNDRHDYELQLVTDPNPRLSAELRAMSTKEFCDSIPEDGF